MNPHSDYIMTEDCILYFKKNPVSMDPHTIKACRKREDFDKFREGFRKEFRLMQHLSEECPTLPKYYSAGIYKGVPAISMEYISGPTLKDYLSDMRKNPSKGPAFLLSREAIFRICTQVYDTLCFLYRKGVVYFDLSPSNIIITDTETFTIKFIDFTFCYDRFIKTKQIYKQYEDESRMPTAGRPLPSSLRRTMMFFTARLFFDSEDSFAGLNREALSRESSFFRKHFGVLFTTLFENPVLSEDILIHDSCCENPDAPVEIQLELLTNFYNNFVSFL